MSIVLSLESAAKTIHLKNYYKLVESRVWHTSLNKNIQREIRENQKAAIWQHLKLEALRIHGDARVTNYFKKKFS